MKILLIDMLTYLLQYLLFTSRKYNIYTDLGHRKSVLVADGFC